MGVRLQDLTWAFQGFRFLKSSIGAIHGQAVDNSASWREGFNGLRLLLFQRVSGFKRGKGFKVCKLRRANVGRSLLSFHSGTVRLLTTKTWNAHRPISKHDFFAGSLFGVPMCVQRVGVEREDGGRAQVSVGLRVHGPGGWSLRESRGFSSCSTAVSPLADIHAPHDTSYPESNTPWLLIPAHDSRTRAHAQYAFSRRALEF